MPNEPYFRFSHIDGKVQIFSFVPGVKMFPNEPGPGQTAQNYVAEVDTEEEAFDLLDRLKVPQNKRPERNKSFRSL